MGCLILLAAIVVQWFGVKISDTVWLSILIALGFMELRDKLDDLKKKG